MQNKVIKIGNVSFLSQLDKSIIKKILNADFEINDDFSGNRSKIEFDSSAEVSFIQEGVKVSSNSSEVSVNPLKIYFAKYKKSSCNWEDVIYYGILEDYNEVVVDKWEFLYVNEQYCVYRIFSYSMPATLPLDGDLPSSKEAPFMEYESFSNVWMRDKCKFKYDEFIVSLVGLAGNDEWVLNSSGDSECLFSYTKSTPFGCDFSVPSVNSIDIGEECECLTIYSSSSSSSFSDTVLNKSSSSSESSESSPSSETSSLNSSSSEIRMSPENVSTLYIRIVGDPFIASEYVLPLRSSTSIPLVWSSSSHSSDSETIGTVSVSMNGSGRFLLSVDATVNGSKVVIANALLSNIANDNFANYSGYLKGLATVCSGYITTAYVSDDGKQTFNYDCIISYETLNRNNGSPKKLSEIIYDYEMAELSIDNDSEKVQLYFGKANIDKDKSEDICRAWGLFCLNYVKDGEWSYSNDDQEIKLSRTDGGCWNIYRKYNNSLTDSQEIEMEIDSKAVTANTSGEYDGFGGICVVPRALIMGGVSESSNNDVCNDKDTVVAFYSSDSCSQNSNYSPYYGDISLTIDGGGWVGKKSYSLKPSVISSNLSVWNWSSDSNSNYFEYAVLFSHDGILWKFMAMNKNGDSKNYIFTEFIKENLKYDTFSPVFSKIHKSYLSLDGEWGTGEATITISSK